MRPARTIKELFEIIRGNRAKCARGHSDQRAMIRALRKEVRDAMARAERFEVIAYRSSDRFQARMDRQLASMQEQLDKLQEGLRGLDQREDVKRLGDELTFVANLIRQREEADHALRTYRYSAYPPVIN